MACNCSKRAPKTDVMLPGRITGRATMTAPRLRSRSIIKVGRVAKRAPVRR